MIQGERVLLRPMEASDTDDVVRLRNEPSVLSQLFADEPISQEGHLKWLERKQKDGDRQEFMIVERGSGRSIGTIGLSHIDLTHRRAEYGILIGDLEARGKGLALEASQLLLQYAFEKLALHRIYLHVFPENVPAIRLYKRLGFEQEGLLRHHVYKNGRYHDVFVMSILRAGQT